MISILILKIKMLTISTFNIQNDFKDYDISKTLTIMKYLRENKIDILGLQEVYSKCSNDFLKEAEKMNYQIRGKYRFFLKKILNRFNEKTPIVTDKEIISSKTYHLPHFPMPLKRIVTKVVIKYENKLISIYNTHLDYKSNDVKKRQLKRLYKLIQNDNNLIILMGDFNLKNNNSVFNDFVDLLKIKGIFRVELNEKTLKQSKYKREIDHIFLSQEFKVLDKKVIKDLDISDHFPVLINVEI